jgi:hypothetical protein
MSDNQQANTRRKQLRQWMQERGMNGTDLATRLGTGRAYVSLLFKPDRHFGEKAARSIEQKLFMPTGYLDAQAPAMAPVDVWENPADLPDGVYALVPRIGIKLSAGSGMEAVEETELPPLAFRESWLKKKHVTSRKHLRILEVDGPSMEPLLMDGDVVLVDLGQHDIIDNEVYAIAYGSELRIKRLSKRFDGGLLIRSDNQRYPDEAISPAESQHIRVLGRMIWRGG